MDKIKKYQDEEGAIKVPRFEEEGGFYASARSSATMSKIRSKNTKVEIKLRKAIWNYGYRYRIHTKKIIGNPDIIFNRYKVIVFIDGDFWHGYNWEEKKKKLIANRAYWIPKIERNMQRDKEVTRILINDGWTVIRLWEHEVLKDFDGSLKKIILKLGI